MLSLVYSWFSFCLMAVYKLNTTKYAFKRPNKPQKCINIMRTKKTYQLCQTPPHWLSHFFVIIYNDKDFFCIHMKGTPCSLPPHSCLSLFCGLNAEFFLRDPSVKSEKIWLMWCSKKQSNFSYFCNTIVWKTETG